ncbi:hypothetical protein K388_05916 [Streptomyces sp. KhCrAH-43]|uniref:hypothetical protein n=1 Tax=unclassified Streptomyces TaxID=2593676 RepID=UPI00036408B9|nr:MULTISPECIES: hypothetical protein [unclassified Streptomyces]RAJ52816.1 hypothetical protein K388_05916 [Streptomyces sp. KhCrAH-43]
MALQRSSDSSSRSSSGSSAPRAFTPEQKAGQQSLNDRLTCARLEERPKDAPPGSF